MKARVWETGHYGGLKTGYFGGAMNFIVEIPCRVHFENQQSEHVSIRRCSFSQKLVQRLL